MDAILEAEKFLSNHIKIRETEKGKFGEVFTPPELIDDMLSSLPKNVWTNKNLIWLDPACGFGNFTIKIIKGGHNYTGLFEGLKHDIPDSKKRIKYILENMVYMYDINEDNVKITKKLLSTISPNTKPNVINRNFLDVDGINPDIIVGNPPYNSGGTKLEGVKRLHVAFVKKSLELIKQDGFLLFICPPNYREADSDMNIVLREKGGSFKYIRIFGPEKTHKYFNIQARVDIFLYQNKHSKEKTLIIDEYDQIGQYSLDLNKHVPNFGLSIFEKIRNNGTVDIDAFRNTQASTVNCKKSQLSKKGRFPIIHLITKDGKKIYNRIVPHLYQKTPKLLVNGLGVPYVFYDDKGKYGFSQTPVVVLNPTKQFVEFCRSKFFQFIAWALRITGNNNMPYLFKDIPIDYGKKLKLTTSEKELIESFSIPNYKNIDLIQTCLKTRKNGV